jgi:hypothetical protein
MSGMAASGGAFSPSPSLDISDLGGDDSDIDDDFDPEDYGDE